MSYPLRVTISDEAKERLDAWMKTDARARESDAIEALIIKQCPAVEKGKGKKVAANA